MGFYAERIFPWILDATEPPGLADIRREVLSGVRGRILEVGFGTGGNLPYYPSEVRKLTVIEPSGGMKRRAAKRIANWGGEIESVPFDGPIWPLPDASFDTVVMTLVLCSASDPAGVLSEIARVLKPGGHYISSNMSPPRTPQSCATSSVSTASTKSSPAVAA